MASAAAHSEALAEIYEIHLSSMIGYTWSLYGQSPGSHICYQEMLMLTSEKAVGGVRKLRAPGNGSSPRSSSAVLLGSAPSLSKIKDATWQTIAVRRAPSADRTSGASQIWQKDARREGYLP